MCLILTSCSNGPKEINVDSTKRHYSYLIGQGETIQVGRKDYNFEKSVTDLQNDMIFNSYTIKSIQLGNGKILSKEDGITVTKGDYYFDLRITCINPFEKVYIDYVKYYFEEDNSYLNLKYDVELSYNSEYLIAPTLSEQYRSSIIMDDKTVYILLRLQPLGLTKNDSFIINSFFSNDEQIKINNKEYAPYKPYIYDENGIRLQSFQTIYRNLDYNVFENVDLKDYTDFKEMDGIVLKFDLSIEDNMDSVGTDIMFDIEINGDSYIIPYHLQYDTQII